MFYLFYRSKLRGIKPYRFRIALQVIRVIRVICEICGLKRLLRINLGEAEDQRFELFEPEGRVFKSPGAGLRFIKKGFRPSEKGFGQQPFDN